MPRGRVATIKQRREIRGLTLQGFGATAIYDDLTERQLLEDPHPTLSFRTIQRMVKDYKPRDDSRPWSFASASKEDPEEAALVLDVAIPLFDRTDCRVWPSEDLAGWIARVRRAYPDIDPLYPYAFARAYQAAGENADTRPIDVMLGARIWNSGIDEDLWVRVYEKAMATPGWEESTEEFFSTYIYEITQNPALRSHPTDNSQTTEPEGEPALE